MIERARHTIAVLAHAIELAFVRSFERGEWL